MVLLLSFDALGSLFLLLADGVFTRPGGYLTYLVFYCSRMLLLGATLVSPERLTRWLVPFAVVVTLQLVPMVRSFAGPAPAHTYITIVMGLSMVVAVLASRRGLTLYLVVACPVVAVLVFEAGQLGAVAIAEMLYSTFFTCFPAAMLHSYRTRLSRAISVAQNLARVDPLTGALNRRGLHERLVDLAARAWRDGATVQLLVVDLDHFKQVNDRYGHLAGDEVLVLAAKGVRGAIHPDDLLARTGGEEFVVARAGRAEGVQQLGDRVRRELTRATGEYHVSASVGAVVEDPPAGGELTARWFDSLVGRADTALYDAKRTGRDRVVVHGEVVSSSSTPPSESGGPGASASGADAVSGDGLVRPRQPHGARAAPT